MAKEKQKTENRDYLYVSISTEKMRRGEPCLWFKVKRKDEWLTPEQVEALVAEHGMLPAFRSALQTAEFVRGTSEARAVGHVRRR